MKIPFNRPYFTGKEKNFIGEAIMLGKISGNGYFTQKCQEWLEKKFGHQKCLLTTSCTDALEMCALLLNINPGDEVIVPSFTFVSTALAFAMRGAKIVFADSLPDHPNIDPESVRNKITLKTKAIVIMHYAGYPCRMDEFMQLADEYGIYLVEDSAHAIDSQYEKRYLGSFGLLSAYSFHETKNLHCGEGGSLNINKPELIERAEILWEKGTNRAAFGRGETTFYEWKDFGSSYLPSEILAAFLYAQLLEKEKIQDLRKTIWRTYYNRLKPLSEAQYLLLPPDVANASFFYILTKNKAERDHLLSFLQQEGIQAVFHYLPLHQSSFARQISAPAHLPHAEHFADCMVRLPFFNELKEEEINFCCEKIFQFYS